MALQFVICHLLRLAKSYEVVDIDKMDFTVGLLVVNASDRFVSSPVD